MLLTYVHALYGPKATHGDTASPSANDRGMFLSKEIFDFSSLKMVRIGTSESSLCTKP